MTTSTDITNRALAAIASRTTVANLALEQSAEAKQARLLYDPTRDALLRAAHWNFARRTTYLSLLKSAPGTPENPTGGAWNPATMPAPPWLYEYAYPSDCLLVRYVTPPPPTGGNTTPPIFSSPITGPIPMLSAQPVAFSVASSTDSTNNPINVVLTNAQTALGCYTMRVESEDLWDASFQEAMAFALGSRLALALTGNVEVARSSAQQAMGALMNARARDGNEGLTRLDHTPDWLVARGYSPGIVVENFVAPWSTPAFLVM
jgi:hypothetical protein